MWLDSCCNSFYLPHWVGIVLDLECPGDCVKVSCEEGVDGIEDDSGLLGYGY